MTRRGLQAHQVKVYGITVPLTGFESISCEEAQCQAYRNGWRTALLEGDGDFGDKSAYEIRHSKYSYIEERREDGFTVFTFAPGQTCFKGLAGAHKRRKPDAPEFYTVRDGRTGRVRQHNRPSDWVDDFANHQDTLVSAIEKG